MEELKDALAYLYEKFGTNEVTLAFSKYIDELIVPVQREKLKKENKNRGGN